jgi:hypothetical protein
MRLRKVIIVTVAVLICSILAFNNYSNKHSYPTDVSGSETTTTTLESEIGNNAETTNGQTAAK